DRNVTGVQTCALPILREPGIFMRGGTNENTPTILTGYPGEVAILDGQVQTEIIVKMEGQYNILENLVVRNAAKYNVLVSGKYSRSEERRVGKGSSIWL